MSRDENTEAAKPAEEKGVTLEQYRRALGLDLSDEDRAVFVRARHLRTAGEHATPPAKSGDDDA